MKRILAISIILVLMFTTACTGSINTTKEVSSEIVEKVNALITTKVESVKNLDLDKYIATLNPGDKELITEQTNWFNDIKLMPIKEYGLKLNTLEMISSNVYKANLEQHYIRDKEIKKVVLDEKYVLIDDILYDEGNYFDEIQTKHFTIKYTPVNIEFAKGMQRIAEEAYKESFERWSIVPERKLVIKIFDDIEIQRQSVKLSMWSFAGWYEFGESIKMYIDNENNISERVGNTLRHELTHTFTMTKTNGNLPYWVAEGLATYYSQNRTTIKDIPVLKQNGTNIMKVSELEATELEKLEDSKAIGEYYTNSCLITSFLIEKYGEQAMNQILEKLGEKLKMQGASSENDKIYREYLHEVLPKTLGLKNYAEFEAVWEREIKK